MAFDVERFRARASARKSKLGQPIVWQDVTGSTNDDALAAARAGAPHGAVFVADVQTAGRGRRGHAWLARPGEGLLFSVLLRPALDLAQTSALTLAIGLALRDAIAPIISSAASIKWPNDVLVAGKKLAGVLVESQLQGDRLQAVVVGVGLNVSSREFPEEIAARATSLALLGATRLERETLLGDVLDAISTRVLGYEAGGIAAILPELNAADALRDKRVRVDAVTGAARGLDEHGRLRLEDDAGEMHALSSGTVELV